MESIQIKRLALAIVAVPVILFIFNFLITYVQELFLHITNVNHEIIGYAKTGLVIAVGLWLISIAYGWVRTGELRMLAFFDNK